jgi:hypothetical protein
VRKASAAIAKTQATLTALKDKIDVTVGDGLAALKLKQAALAIKLARQQSAKTKVCIGRVENCTTNCEHVTSLCNLYHSEQHFSSRVSAIYFEPCFKK